MVVRHSPGSRRLTLGADKAYDVHGFVDDLRDLNVTAKATLPDGDRSLATCLCWSLNRRYSLGR
jgi:hypothetical protein